MKITKQQKTEIYSWIEKMLTIRKDLGVCTLLQYRSCFVLGTSATQSELPRLFPEFYSQKPDGMTRGDLWWPLGDTDRVEAIRNAKEMVG